MKTSDLLLKSFLAGIFIAIGGFVYLSVGNIPGAIMFAFGLLSVVTLGTPLYTGTAGFKFYVTGTKNKLWKLPLILLFNVFGCMFIGILSHASSKDIEFVAEELVYNRIIDGWFTDGLLAIGCGIIMTTAVAAKTNYNTFLPLLFGIPVFILCGFPHSIADAFYISSCSNDFIKMWWPEILEYWGSVIVGNFIGCNIHNIIGYNFVKDL